MSKIDKKQTKNFDYMDQKQGISPVYSTAEPNWQKISKERKEYYRNANSVKNYLSSEKAESNRLEVEENKCKKPGNYLKIFIYHASQIM